MAAVPDFQLEKVILAREHARNDAWQRKNREALDALLDADFIEINVLGRFVKKEVLGVLFNAVTLHAITVEKPQLITLGENAVVLTYRCRETITMGGEQQEIPANVTSVYAKRDAQWKLLLWQITPLIRSGKVG